MTTSLPTLLLADPAFLAHNTGPGHPETAERLRRIVRDLRRDPVEGTDWVEPRPATRDELIAVHSSVHVDNLAALVGQDALRDPDTPVSPGTWQATARAAGAAVMAVEEVWAGRARTAFALVRPPGQHAEAATAMGFCLINNAAVAAAAARRLGAQRVAIVDWDVHHGNGTQHQFEARSDVLFHSSHQYPFYPGTDAASEIGRGAGIGYPITCALPAEPHAADYGAVIQDLFLPALQRFQPELVIVSAGFDAHARDPLAEMRVTERGFAAICAAVRA